MGLPLDVNRVFYTFTLDVDWDVDCKANGVLSRWTNLGPRFGFIWACSARESVEFGLFKNRNVFSR